MTDTHKLDEIAAQFGPERNVATGTWFGKPCLKTGGKVFVALFEGDMAFKLAGKAHAEALQIEGAHLFDPRGKGHPMKEWVQIPAAHSSTWSRFVELACNYVARAAQVKKDNIIAELIEARRNLLDAASSLSPAEQDEVFLGVWSVKDLLAHFVGWDFANLESVKGILVGQLPNFYSHYDRDWQSFNARLVAEHKRDDFADLISSIENSHRELVDFLKTVPAEEFEKDRGVRFKGYKVTIVRTLEAEIKDAREHCAQIEAFADRFVESVK
jgi:uncharacterized damage-inducible protein DinB